jgi:ribonuclease Z
LEEIMARLILLGTANALPEINHENTHMAVQADGKVILIDCVGSPKVRLNSAGLRLNAVTDLILTHFHPDHVSGVPLLLMNMWLLGRKNDLCIYGLSHCLERVEKMMDLYDWKSWPDFFSVDLHRIPDHQETLVLKRGGIRIISSPVRHLVPTIGLRFESLSSGRKAAYSCDTEPCSSMVQLAERVDVLIHEATGAGQGHSSASQAGSIAREAGVKTLLLIHYAQDPSRETSLIEQAQKTFDGEVGLAEDFMVIEL